MDTHRPVDVLPDREAATFATWLAEHPGTTVVCRNRTAAYAEGARAGAPAAIQVADRRHVWNNLAGYVEKTVAAHYHGVRSGWDPQPETSAEAPAEASAVDLADAARAAHAEQKEQTALVVRTKERYEAVQALKTQGKGIKMIKRQRYGRASFDLLRKRILLAS